MAISIFFISYLFYLYLREEKKKSLLIKSFLLGQTVSILVSLLQKYFGLKLFFGVKPFNGLASHTVPLGFLSSIAFLLAFYTVSRNRKNLVGYLFLVTSFIGIIHSTTRTAFITIVFVLIYFFVKVNWKKKLLIVLVIVLLCINFLYYGRGFDIDKQFKFVNDIEHFFWKSIEIIIPGDNPVNIHKILSPRDLLWKYSLELLTQYPLCGVGPGNFLFFVRYAYYGEYSFYDLPCNQYLFISSDLGLIGLLAFIIFLVGLGKRKTGIEKWIFICILVLIFFSNYFWYPECFLAFWLAATLENGREKPQKIKARKFLLILFWIMTGIYIFSNIYHFQDLHPKTWANKTSTRYDYGFWYEEENQNGETFNWTRAKAGFYIYLDQGGNSRQFRLVCGAPLKLLKANRQEVTIFWRKRFYKRIIFKENSASVFQIKDRLHGEGFLEIRVDPVFNLKKLDISSESRDLGIQFYMGK
jgi:hypothetical protein